MCIYSAHGMAYIFRRALRDIDVCVCVCVCVCVSVRVVLSVVASYPQVNLKSRRDATI